MKRMLKYLKKTLLVKTSKISQKPYLFKALLMRDSSLLPQIILLNGVLMLSNTALLLVLQIGLGIINLA